MSGHRPGLAPLPDERYHRNFSVRVTCAHGVDGPHDVLAHLTDRRTLTHPGPAILLAPETGRDGGPLRNAPLKPFIAPDGHKTWPLRCPRCGEDLPMREERLLRVVDVLRAARGKTQEDEHLELELGLARKIAARLLH
jgi:hypothetical protein